MLALTSPAFAESDNANSNGTFAGQITRGSQVKVNAQCDTCGWDNHGEQIQQYKDSTGNGWSYAVQTKIGQPGTIGYGSLGK
jgi:hypothetical protein